MDPRPHRSSILRDIIIGASAESVQCAVLYPLETWKVRCQMSGLAPLAELRSMLSAGSVASVSSSLYVGMRPAALGAAAFGGSYFLVYQFLFRRSARLLGVTTDGEPLAPDASVDIGLLGLAAGLSSGMANCVTAVVEVPLDTVRQQMQAGVVRGSMPALLRQQLQAGPASMYCGLAPFLARNIPQDALQFCLFASARALPRARAAEPGRSLRNLCCSCQRCTLTCPRGQRRLATICSWVRARRLAGVDPAWAVG